MPQNVEPTAHEKAMVFRLSNLLVFLELWLIAQWNDWVQFSSWSQWGKNKIFKLEINSQQSYTPLQAV